MIINTTIVLVKYLNPTPISIPNIPAIRGVVLFNNFGNQVRWTRGLPSDEQPYDQFEYGKSYLIFSDANSSYNLEVGTYDSLTDVQITSPVQIDLYKGLNSNISQYPNIKAVRRTGTSISWETWLIGLPADDQTFSEFEDGKIYIIYSTSVPYTLWQGSTSTEVFLLTENSEFLTTEDNYLLVA